MLNVNIIIIENIIIMLNVNIIIIENIIIMLNVNIQLSTLIFVANFEINGLHFLYLFSFKLKLFWFEILSEPIRINKRKITRRINMY